MIPLFQVRIQDGCAEAIAKTLRSRYIGEGPRVKEFEQLLSDYLGGYVVLVNSGTSALHLALQIADVYDHQVISTPMTCLATNTPIIHNGGHIIWADVDPNTGNADLESIRRKINPRTKAVMVVHYGGNLCDPSILRICRDRNVALIEDCAHLNNRGLGGDLECFSFQAIKFLTTGDGGALVTGDKKTYERAKLLRWYGINRDTGSSMRCLNEIQEVGHKFHMNDIAASIGINNFKLLDDSVRASKKNAAIYNLKFKQLKKVRTIPVKTRHDYWLYTLLVDEKEDFMNYMRGCNIETSLVHARNDTQPVFAKFLEPLPGLDSFWKRQVSIPVGWWLSNTDVSHIIKSVEDYEKVCVS